MHISGDNVLIAHEKHFTLLQSHFRNVSFVFINRLFSIFSLTLNLKVCEAINVIYLYMILLFCLLWWHFLWKITFHVFCVQMSTGKLIDFLPSLYNFKYTFHLKECYYSFDRLLFIAVKLFIYFFPFGKQDEKTDFFKICLPKYFCR